SQSATVNTAVTTDPAVLVRDAFGNPVANVNVTFTVTGGGGTILPASPATIATNSSGVAALNSWTLGTTAGTNTITAASTGLTGSPVTFTATGTSGTATQIAMQAGNGQSAIVNTAVTTDPSVIVRDAFGNPVANVNVTFTVTGGGGTITPASPAIVATNASGIATLTTWTLGSTAGANTLSASSTGLAGSPVTFTATGTAAAASQIAMQAGNSQSATVGTAIAIDPSVIVRDAFNNPVSGVSVTFTVTSGGGTIAPASPATIATDINGIATLASWTLGPTAGANTLTAASTGLAGSPVTFTATGTAGAATQIAMQAGNGQSATVNSAVATDPSVVVRDAFNNPVSSVSVTFTVTGGGGTISPASPATIATDINGIATLTSWTLGPTAGANTLTAASTGLTGSPVAFTATGTAGAATQIAIQAGNGQSATVSSAVTTDPAVLVRDAFNNVVSGVSVTFTVTGGGGTIAPASPATIVTNASGIAALTTWTLGTTAGTNTLSAASTGLTGSPVTFTATATPAAVSAAATTVSAAPGTIAASSGATTSTITVTARDQFNNPIQGATVVLAASGSGNTVTQPVGTTNASGVATGTLSSTAAGSKTVSATVNGVAITQTATVTVTAGAVNAAQSTVIAAPTSITAGTGTSTITVTARDANGNPIQGATIVLAASGSGNTVTQPGLTNASGVATGTLSSTVAEDKTISATINAVGINQTATVTVTPGSVSATQSTVVAAPTSILAGTETSTITVTAKDEFGNLIQNAAVVLFATGSGNTLDQPAGNTNASGVATGSLSSAVPESKIVSATINSVAITQTATVTVEALP
ncbi:MAG TPA: Ig-like domain-containing protein, partial [Gemmatimonadales bacterium]|nr:Ig-like domain-containing protein [Gemmatimonadales bacterium]